MDARAPVRRIKKVWKSVPTLEGAGVRLNRVFGFREVPQLDPFLLLDGFHSDNRDDYARGFPWHPHRGIETITYVLDGDVEHQDSLGNQGIIRSGDVQWMTAGSGIIHQEMPKGDAKGRMWGFQLWANLPRRQKMMDPRYREVLSTQIPAVKSAEGATVRIICGEIDGVQGPVREIMTDPEYLDVSLPSGKSFTHSVKPGYTVFAYVVEGEAYFDPGRNPFEREAVGENYFDMKPPCACTEGAIALYEPADRAGTILAGEEAPRTAGGAADRAGTILAGEAGRPRARHSAAATTATAPEAPRTAGGAAGDTVVVTTEKQPVRFLLVSGKPLKEPVAWYGPIVMNTQEELKTAFAEFQAGTFIKGEALSKK